MSDHEEDRCEYQLAPDGEREERDGKAHIESGQINADREEHATDDEAEERPVSKPQPQNRHDRELLLTDDGSREDEGEDEGPEDAEAEVGGPSADERKEPVTFTPSDTVEFDLRPRRNLLPPRRFTDSAQYTRLGGGLARVDDEEIEGPGGRLLRRLPGVVAMDRGERRVRSTCLGPVT